MQVEEEAEGEEDSDDDVSLPDVNDAADPAEVHLEDQSNNEASGHQSSHEQAYLTPVLQPSFRPSPSPSSQSVPTSSLAPPEPPIPLQHILYTSNPIVLHKSYITRHRAYTSNIS